MEEASDQGESYNIQLPLDHHQEFEECRILIVGRNLDEVTSFAFDVTQSGTFRPAKTGFDSTIREPPKAQIEPSTRIGGKICRTVAVNGLMFVKSDKANTQKLLECLYCVLPGLHFVFLIVDGTTLEEDLSYYDFFKNVFGTEILPHTSIVTTRMDAAARDDEKFQAVLAECGSRYITVENKEELNKAFRNIIGQDKGIFLKKTSALGEEFVNRTSTALDRELLLKLYINLSRIQTQQGDGKISRLDVVNAKSKYQDLLKSEIKIRRDAKSEEEEWREKNWKTIEEEETRTEKFVSPKSWQKYTNRRSELVNKYKSLEDNARKSGAERGLQTEETEHDAQTPAENDIVHDHSIEVSSDTIPSDEDHREKRDEEKQDEEKRKRDEEKRKRDEEKRDEEKRDEEKRKRDEEKRKRDQEKRDQEKRDQKKRDEEKRKRDEERRKTLHEKKDRCNQMVKVGIICFAMLVVAVFVGKRWNIQINFIKK